MILFLRVKKHLSAIDALTNLGAVDMMELKKSRKFGTTSKFLNIELFLSDIPK
jgi:hypothetical protein